jgi:hypothetical protein
MKSVEDRWLSNIDVVGEDVERSCWLWKGAKTKQGYGKLFYVDKVVLAHRLGWELAGNKLPAKKLMLKNLCGNISCVNPEHWVEAAKNSCVKSSETANRMSRQQKLEEFANKVDENGPLILDTPCWTWIGAKKPNGYGQFSSVFYSSYAHRASWEIFNGSIPDGLFVCHHCDNPSCVNPEHLFLGTPCDNMRDMAQKGRGRKPVIKVKKGVYLKLTDDQIRLIRQDVRTLSEIAKDYAVDQSTISLIRHRKRRANVKD